MVAHWDAVSGSIARLRPWAIADHVIHTGFTVSWRERKEGELPELPAAPGCNIQPSASLTCDKQDALSEAMRSNIALSMLAKADPNDVQMAPGENGASRQRMARMVSTGWKLSSQSTWLGQPQRRFTMWLLAS